MPLTHESDRHHVEHNGTKPPLKTKSKKNKKTNEMAKKTTAAQAGRKSKRMDVSVHLMKTISTSTAKSKHPSTSNNTQPDIVGLS